MPTNPSNTLYMTRLPWDVRADHGAQIAEFATPCADPEIALALCQRRRAACAQ